ncbi:MAG: hypothetical protein R3E82_18040 [Pseudomonadales bacterium]|nr:hypothetical protein [Pseudomonadales bacterium]
MRRLYYIADSLETTKAISETLHDEGITDWNFHVVARNESGLYQHHIHSANTYQQLDIIHTGERWAMIGACVGFTVGMALYLADALPWAPSGMTVVLCTLVGAFFGAWQGGMVGLSRENYKLEPFHHEIEAGRYLIMVDVNDRTRARVREIMNMGFPNVRFCGKDTTLINPFKRPERIQHQNTH